MRRNLMPIDPTGEQAPWLGVNFWSRTGGPLMWRSYDPAVIEQELAVLAEHGLNLTRSFFYWPDLMPTPDALDETMLDRFEDFLDRHVQADMRTIPTFVVGHMSGENWDPAWRQGRDLYGDVWMVARQAWMARELARRFAAHPAVAGWLVSNEMPIYGDPVGRGNNTTDHTHVSSWAQIIVDSLRAGGTTQPVSLGDGAWGVEVTGRDNGFRIREIAPMVDFMGPHVYRMETDQVRQHLNAAYICELLDFTGKPVILEEFGVTTDYVSEENAGHYYRQVLHNTLLAGATGWIGWNNTDYDNLADQDPYRHHPFELHFGVTDNTGRPKAPLRELRDFGKVLDRIDLAHCRRPDTEAAIVVSSYLEEQYPFTVPDDAQLVFETVRQGYVAAREADLPVGLAREKDGLPDDCALYLAPSVKQLTAPTWNRLEELAEGGATCYVSFCAGTHDNQRGPWYAGVDRLFGVRHTLRYGLVHPIEDETVTLTLTQDLGGLPTGTRLDFRAAGTVNSRSFLPVEADGAEVLATDEHGRPALLRRRVGTGSIILCTYPIEHMAAASSFVNPEATHLLYAALARDAGIRQDVTVTDPQILVGELRHEDGRRFIWFTSQYDREVTAKPELAEGLALRDEQGAPISDVDLPPFGVRVLELTTA
ncbi:cellulase family glycosylhydrolase [Streptomyces sp. NBC_00006]|uniref:cellulase family glycosylhydrolase n=1 Tax=unclassified Streptomyces TaxID=2593676 RepID=UPI00225702B5|nr:MULTISPECIES: cellulase family glycosylhydrolase [unclassified Streptomyces]MCX5535787.1 cellulase family glycosylhydrolase [Streptomyces sp. NBC_00006]